MVLGARQRRIRQLKEFINLHAQAQGEETKVVLFNSTSRINSSTS